MFFDTYGIIGIILLIVMLIYQGFNLKFLDQIIDENKKVHIVIVSIAMSISGIFAGFFMCVDSFTGGCVLALILGMIVTKKIDHRLWFVQIILVLGAYIVFLNLFILMDWTLISNFIEVCIIFVVVFVVSILDEIVHDLSSKRGNRFVKFIGGWRFLMKFTVIIMAFLITWVAWYHAIAWIAFDIMYEITARHVTPEMNKNHD